jgi:SAM-dependent methyltransferase
MWRPDVIDLRNFYASHLGQAARRSIRRQVRMIWPNVAGERVLGLGYATPYLRPFRDEAERVVAAMPAQQGVIHWPTDELGQVLLSDETDLPFADASIDKALVVHGLETAEQVRPMLREVWRVLTSGGTVLVVVPNRRGLWARSEGSPFGQGYPYSPPQLCRLLRDTMFLPGEVRSALYLPPSEKRFFLRAAATWESAGQRWWQGFSGVIMVEAGKQIYAAKPDRAHRRRLRVPDLIPAGAAGMRGGGMARDGRVSGPPSDGDRTVTRPGR